ncbi:MAG: nucleotide exchange factor GrpE [Pseudomonadota bacterium]
MTHASGPDDPDLENDHDTQDEMSEARNNAPGPEQAAAAAAALAEENADLKDRVLRMAAEMENLRKRTEREKRDSGQYAIAGFAGDMLVVADNLSRALSTAESTTTESDAGGEADTTPASTLASLKEGVRMTEHELLRLLDKHGVKKIDPEGERFDPHQHQAMFEVPDESVPSGTVVQVAQTGFMIGERVLRPALVGVSKGGPKVKPAAQQAEIDKAAANDDAPTEGGDGAQVDKTV